MEFNVFEYFKDYKRTTNGPLTPEEQGTSFFLAGHMGERVSERVDAYAARARVSRRNFLGTASGFAAAMLAVNEITGMKFFEVTEAEAMDPAAAKEIKVARKPGADFIVDAHTHICWRKDGYIPGVNTTERGMWFVQLLDDLGKAMGLPNGTKDMTVENFGKLILEGSDTSVAIFNPFGFREDYGGKDMIPIEEQAEVKQRWPDRTVMLAGGLTPNQGLRETLDRLQMFVEKYKISGLKLYTFDSTPQRGCGSTTRSLRIRSGRRPASSGSRTSAVTRASRSASSWRDTPMRSISTRSATTSPTSTSSHTTPPGRITVSWPRSRGSS